MRFNEEEPEEGGAAEPAAAASSRDAAAGAETRERERDDEDGACEGAPGGAATEGLPDSREATLPDNGDGEADDFRDLRDGALPPPPPPVS